MSTERLARRSLRLDGLYCVAAGVIAVALAAPLARLLHVATEVLAATGGAAVVWGWLLTRVAASPGWHRPLVLVAAANGAASAGLAVLAVLAPGAIARVLLVAVTVEVATFCAAQIWILRRSTGISRRGSRRARA